MWNLFSALIMPFKTVLFTNPYSWFDILPQHIRLTIKNNFQTLFNPATDQISLKH